MKKNYAFVAAGLGLVQLALLSTPAHAQDTSRVLNDVVVTATRSPKKLSEIGRVVTVITAAEISRSQGKTLPELLNTVPGITFSGANNAPGISSSVFLRGASTGNTLILIDGFPVNNASTIEGAYDLNAFPLDQIDHIEILKGSGSTLYGSDAVAGVINIITRHSTGQGLKSNVQLSGGSYNTFKESAGLIGTVKNTDIALNLSNTDSKGFPAATDTTGKAGFRNDGFHQRSASINLNQHVSDKLVLNGNLQTSYNTGNLPYGAFQDDQNYTYANTFIFGGLGAKLKLDKGDLKFNINQTDVKNNYNDAASAVNFDFPSYQKNTGHITDAEAILNYSIGNHLDLTSGADFKYSNTRQYSTYDTIQKVNNSIASVYTSLFYKSGIFHMELGGRYNHNNKYGSNGTYTINPSVLLFHQLKIFVTAASAYKTPSLYQLFSIYGNTDLKPETTSSFEAGFDWELIQNTLSFNTVFYRNNTKDVLYFLSEATAPYGKYQNGDQQKDKGYESELKLTMKKLTASAYLAYVTGTLTDENGVNTGNLYRRPKFTFGANVYYQVSNGFSAGLNYKYTGDRKDEKFNPDYSVSVITLKPYGLLDAHLQYVINKHFSLFADFKNILDQKYTDWTGYNTSRFNFMEGIKYQIN
ncbi:TonB-dependent receptor plug domain-containing protein [Mucilaginibacter gotjawali]|uniref:Vitamin B12 transporter n=2 Tax=Mucilaginibacter gotjawali TaxID=1550579 RepID=A0A839SD94_9SPHI|nr:TonB-dependent receptor [Mucilaginibacter gotjawali]MBB3055756.1 vitamin B12 transporter [Mucilaginibacter gotjawali]BAU54577.1 Vitamin B12 transporter BtuB precursor [Mucilaginibacter gotjawali]